MLPPLNELESYKLLPSYNALLLENEQRKEHMMEKIIIRRVTTQDIKGLMQIYMKLYEELLAHRLDDFARGIIYKKPLDKLGIVGWVTSDEAEAELALYTFLEDEVNAIFVAELGGTLVGFFEVKMGQDDSEMFAASYPLGIGYPGCLWISEPSFRERGISELLTVAAYQWGL
jgi:hypothetical protein